ncbi:LOW QUALITY PROTEIN: breast cancer anti-estrogen resistance protein 1-like [Tachypleus tridentatus]|uniref:LOW QUALITY PROTEIN: breast cancer anti-estrogen resistance protein 1-like n=1 Tax=Tachypleus tridentatus TaxID=6853 RepID=UPI003FD490C6
MISSSSAAALTLTSASKVGPRPLCNLNCLAKALYDNIAEAPDEIAFRKGDVLTVLEQNTQGLEGWWLCSLRGRQGIAPGNRLRLLPGMYDPSGMGFAGGVTTISGDAPIVAGTYPGPGVRHARRRSWHVNPNKVVMPQKVGDVYLYDVPVGTRIAEEYDVPPTRHGASLNHSLPYDIPPGSQAGSYDTPPSPRAVLLHSTYDEPKSNAPVSVDTDAYDEPQISYPVKKTYNTHGSGKVHDYDLPNSEDCIDLTGKAMSKGEYDIPLCSTNKTLAMELYNVPPSCRSSGVSLLSTSSSSQLSPTSSHSSLNASLSLSSLCGSNRSSIEPQTNDLYDIPQSEPRRVEESIVGYSPAKNVNNTTWPLRSQPNLYDVASSPNALQTYDLPPTPRPTQKTHLEEPYDVPPQVTRDINPCNSKTNDEVDTGQRLSTTSTESVLPPLEGKELPLALDAAMELLMNRHQDVQATINKLFGFFSSSCRKRQKLEEKLYDIQVTCQKLRSALSEFVDFTYGALANSTHASDKTLSYKLFKLIKPLVDSNKIVEATTRSLDEKGWLIVGLISEEPGTPDELDQLVACARGLVEDVRLVSSFIQGNSSLIFKRSTLLLTDKSSSVLETDGPGSQQAGTLNKGYRLQERPLPSPPVQVTKIDDELPLEGKEWMNDYDYVSLESKETVKKENDEIKAALPSELRKSFENLVKQSEVQVKEDYKSHYIENSSKDKFHRLDPNDRQLVHFYSAQVETHMLHLTNAIDAFLTTVKNNQPPKIFIGHSKFVVIGAHKMVYIGDTLNRNVSNPELKTQVMVRSNALCESLKTLVSNTKKAAVQFPSVIAVQEMIDSVVDVSHVAKALQLSITQAVSPL